MSVYEQVYKAYTDSLKNNIWDAWGIVANPKTIYELKAECLEHMMVFNGSEISDGKILRFSSYPLRIM